MPSVSCRAPRVFTALLLVAECGAWLPADLLAQSLSEPRRTSAKFSGPLREPPERHADALHLRLEVAFDWEKKEVQGKVEHTFRALRDGLEALTLDAVGIEVLEAEGDGGRKLRCESLPEKLRVDLGRECKRGEEFRFRLSYRCRPERGVYFRTPDEAYPRAPRQVWTQGEPVEARHWIPCFDHPVDKLTTEVLVTAPPGLLALSNGRLVEEPRPAPGGGRVFHWSQEKPHTTYLIAVVVGEFAEYRDEWRGIPLVAYVPPHRAADAERSFKLTRDMMDFFSARMGVPYPWAKYGQVCVHEFLMGGMENTSLTLLTERTLHDAAAALDVDSVGLVAHELAHQWFGDLITCRDWSEIWLNESFATFFANLYLEKLRGWDEAVQERMEEAQNYLNEDRGEYRRPLVTRRYRDPNDVFDAHAYPKGARVLTMLRYVLGDERFFEGIRRFLEDRAFQPAETAHLRLAMEETSGFGLQWFFDQWVHGGGHPEYQVSWEWDAKEKAVRLRVRQVQKLDAQTGLFRMPVEVEVVWPGGRGSHRVETGAAEETFTFPAAERPLAVRFDPRDWILKEIEQTRSKEELLHELKECPEIAGRIAAARDLGRRREGDARTALLAALGGDRFWGVRQEVARALRTAGGEEVREALLAAFSREEKAAVRREITRALADYPGQRTTDFLRQAFERDTSYFVAADALRSLAKLAGRDAIPDAFRALGRDSHNEEIRIAAVECLARMEALEGKDREEVLDRLLEVHRRGQPIPARMSAGRALARLGRAEERVYRALTAAVEDPHMEMRYQAISHLGDLGDRRGIEVLLARRGKEGHRAFRNPLDAIDTAVKRLEGVGERDQVLDELRRLRAAREDLERRIKLLEDKGQASRPAVARQY